MLAGIFGAADDLIERDLQRWGGKESSNLYNIARKPIFSVFITACMNLPELTQHLLFVDYNAICDDLWLCGEGVV